MKKTLLAATLMLSSAGFCQTALENNPKIELGIQGVSFGYEVPVADDFLVDLNLGFGGVNTMRSDRIGYTFGKTASESNSTLFLRGQLRYYFNRERREEKQRSMANNAGSFLGLQSKFNFKGNGWDVGKAWLNDIHFGQQLPLGQHFIFRYHVGIGYGADMDYKTSTVYPALAATFGYCF